MSRLLQIILFFLMPFGVVAQNAAMADTFREQGKIYVVIGVIAVIFVCLVIFLVYLERKLTRVEKQLQNRERNHGNS